MGIKAEFLHSNYLKGLYRNILYIPDKTQGPGNPPNKHCTWGYYPPIVIFKQLNRKNLFFPNALKPLNPVFMIHGTGNSCYLTVQFKRHCDVHVLSK